jgi:hypothetical protein
MTLLNPAALIFAALAPVIILLYLLKMRRLPALRGTTAKRIELWSHASYPVKHDR